MTNLRQFFKGLKKGIHNFGQCIAIIINSVLLSIVYLLGVGLTSIFAKLSNKHFLDVMPSKKKDSYWSDLNLKKKSIGEYYKQF